jgi:uncharacterized cupredoxin-like copper-binding protein
MRPSASLSRILRLSVAVGATALVVAGCGSSSSSSSTQSAANTTGGATGTPVAVTLKNFSITLSTMPSKPGTYTFTVTNTGPSAHNLTIAGPEVNKQTTGTFAAGSAAKTLTVTLQNGKYDFYCSVPGHKQLGMNVEVTIGGSSSGSGAASTGGSSSSGGSWS